MRLHVYVVALASLVMISFGKTVEYGRFKFADVSNDPEAWILVMGLTGAGKSSFVRDAVGVDNPNLSDICHGLEPCTASVNISPWRWDRKTMLYLVDTPGFDDTYRSDEEILTEIATDLAGLYKSGVSIGAVIYLHRISDPKLQHGALRSISTLREIVGHDKFPAVIFATTWWKGVDSARAVKREAELSKKGNYWGAFIKGGAKVMRHDDGEKSARKIMNEAIRRATSVPLKIQTEMVSDKFALKDTSAMLALESFDFFVKLQNRFAKGEISITEYASEIRTWMQRKKDADAGFWDKHGSDMIGILTTVAQTAIMVMGGQGGVETIILSAIIEAAYQWGWMKKKKDVEEDNRRFEL